MDILREILAMLSSEKHTNQSLNGQNQWRKYQPHTECRTVGTPEPPYCMHDYNSDSAIWGHGSQINSAFRARLSLEHNLVVTWYLTALQRTVTGSFS